MAEVIAALIEGLAQLVAAVVELCIQLVAIVLRSLGFAVGTLAEKPGEGEARFSGKRLLIAFAPLVVIILVVGGVFGVPYWREEARHARTRATQTLVKEHVDQLAEQVDESGQFLKHPAPTLEVEDAWGNPLRVAYEDTLTHHRVVVCSVGEDGKMDTPDDVSSSRRRVRPKREIAIGVLGKMKKVIEERLDDSE